MRQERARGTLKGISDLCCTVHISHCNINSHSLVISSVHVNIPSFSERFLTVPIWVGTRSRRIEAWKPQCPPVRDSWKQLVSWLLSATSGGSWVSRQCKHRLDTLYFEAEGQWCGSSRWLTFENPCHSSLWAATLHSCISVMLSCRRSAWRIPRPVSTQPRERSSLRRNAAPRMWGMCVELCLKLSRRRSCWKSSRKSHYFPKRWRRRGSPNSRSDIEACVPTLEHLERLLYEESVSSE